MQVCLHASTCLIPDAFLFDSYLGTLSETGSCRCCASTNISQFAVVLCRQVLESPDASSIDTEDLSRFGKSLLGEGPCTNRLLAPWMLTCASQLMLASPADGVSGATESDLCQDLVNAAEASNPIRVLHELFAHESMCDPERQRRYADIAFYVLGSWCKAFTLKVTTLPYEAVQDLLTLIGDIFQENPILTRSVA
jgi:hypothetical protein